MRFFFEKKHAWKIFKAWPYAIKYFYLPFFFFFGKKTRYFNTELVSYIVSIQPNIQQNLVGKYFKEKKNYYFFF